MSGISEIDGSGPSHEPVEKKPKLELAEKCIKRVSTTTFIQAPVLPCVYTDPETKVDKCLVVVLLYHNVKKIDFDLVESKEGPEPTLKITYGWPPLMYDMKSMFTKGGEEQMFTPIHHPKVMAIEKALQQYRANVEDVPVGNIEVKLPVQVLMDPNTWIQTFNKKPDGTIIAFLEFTCKRDDYLIAKAEKTMTFD